MDPGDACIGRYSLSDAGNDNGSFGVKMVKNPMRVFKDFFFLASKISDCFLKKYKVWQSGMLSFVLVVSIMDASKLKERQHPRTPNTFCSIDHVSNNPRVAESWQR